MDMKSAPSVPRNFSDVDYIQGLKANNAEIVHRFFYDFCYYMLSDIRVSVLCRALEYDELVDELYIYLSEENWHRLDTFQGPNSYCLKSWMVRLCWRFFMRRREVLLGLPADENVDVATVRADEPDSFDIEMRLDVESTFEAMPNGKYAQVLRLLLLEGYPPEEVAEVLQTTVSNVYNLKHRAIVQFVNTYCARV